MESRDTGAGRPAAAPPPARAAAPPSPGSARASGERRGWWPSPSDAAEQRGPVTHAVFRISRKNRGMVSDLLRPLGLYAGQELLLLQLRDHDGCSQQNLVAALGLDHSTVTKMLQRLERAGMVAREPSAADRRATLVRLTPEGRRLCGKVEDIWTQLEEATVGCLSSRQRQQLRQLLALVEGGLQASSAPHRP